MFEIVLEKVWTRHHISIFKYLQFLSNLRKSDGYVIWANKKISEEVEEGKKSVKNHTKSQ